MLTNTSIYVDKQEEVYHPRLVEGFKATVVNGGCSSLNQRLLEITHNVPLKIDFMSSSYSTVTDFNCTCSINPIPGYNF